MSWYSDMDMINRAADGSPTEQARLTRGLAQHIKTCDGWGRKGTKDAGKCHAHVRVQNGKRHLYGFCDKCVSSIAYWYRVSKQKLLKKSKELNELVGILENRKDDRVGVLQAFNKKGESCGIIIKLGDLDIDIQERLTGVSHEKASA